MDLFDVVVISFGLGVMLCWLGGTVMEQYDQGDVAAIGVVGVVTSTVGAVCIAVAVVLVAWWTLSFVDDAIACLNQFELLCSPR